jgi:hypothetical protein
MAAMKNSKIQASIDKARAKLAEQQALIKELEKKQTELENMQIVDTVRGLDIPLDRLLETLKSIKNGAFPAAVSTSGQLGPMTGSDIGGIKSGAAEGDEQLT